MHPGRGRAQGPRVAVRHRRASRAAAARTPSRSRRLERALDGLVICAAPRCREKPQMRCSTEQRVLGNGRVLWSCGNLRHERDPPRDLAPPQGRARRRRTPRPARCRGTRPAAARSVVVLPAPFGPIRPTHSPSRRRQRRRWRIAAPPSVDRHPLEAEARSSESPAGLQDDREEGSPEERGDDPDRELAGETTVRASTSASTRKPPPTRTESGSREPVAPAHQEPDRVRDDDPDERDQAR